MSKKDLEKFLEELEPNNQWTKTQKNLIMRIMGEAEVKYSSKGFEDIGFKKENGMIVHEFMIDNESFFITKL